MKIFLIGMPGSGKSTIGRLLADKLKYKFADLDTIIEERAQRTVQSLFADGEEAFREAEHEALLYVCQEECDAVIASGGGTPCFFDNMTVINSSGTSIFIDVPLATLIERTSKSAKRPLLQGNKEEKLKSLLKERKAYYKQAKIHFQTDGADSATVASRLLRVLDS